MKKSLVYRPGWPSNVIGPGKEAWTAFCRLATDEQVDRALETLARLLDEHCLPAGETVEHRP